MSIEMTDTTDPKKDDTQGDSSQGGAFGGVPFDEAQKKKAPDVGFSLDMDDLPDLDDISLDLDDDTPEVVEEDLVSADEGGLDATGDVSLDDINLDDISLDDINLDTIVGSDASGVSDSPVDSPKETPEKKPEPTPEISLADLYKKPMKEEAEPSVSDFDLGDLDLSDKGDTVTDSATNNVSDEVVEKKVNVIDPVIPQVSQEAKSEPLKKDKPIDDVTPKAPVTTEPTSKDFTQSQKEKTPSPIDVVSTGVVVAPIKKIDVPLGASKVVKKFVEVLNIICEGSSLVDNGKVISVVGIHTDKQHISYDFTHSDDTGFHVTRNATDPSNDKKTEWQLDMEYNESSKSFDLTLDDVAVYTESGDVISDKSLQHTVTDKLGKFALLLSEFVRKEKKQREEILRQQEEKKKQRDVAKKLREF